jgi:PQQ-like domain
VRADEEAAMGGWRRLGCLAAAVVVAAPGCWLQSGYDARRSGANGAESTITAANVAGLVRAWDVPGGRSPVVSGATVYVPTAGDVVAVDLASGANRWTAAGVGASDVAVAGDRLWAAIGDTGCSLRALNPATGATITTVGFGGNAFDFGSNGRSYCSTTEVLVSGQRVMTSWSYIAGAIAPGSCFPGFTYQSGSGTITLDAVTGAVVSRTGGVGSPGCALDPPAGVSTLSTDGTTTYMVTGTVVTRFGTCGSAPCGPLPLPAGSSGIGPAVPAAGGRLVVTPSVGKVVVLDRSSGAVQWSGTFASASLSPPAVISTTVYVTGSDGVVAAFPLAGCGAATCSPSWFGTTSGEVSNRPTVGGDVVYVAEGAGHSVAAFAAGGCGASTCDPVARVNLPHATYRSPVVAAGTLLVQDGEALAAFRLR